MPGVGYRMLERRWLPRLTAENVDGTLTARTPDVGTGELWLVDVIALSSSPTTSCTCRLYHGDATPANYLVKSVDASEDTFEGEITIDGGSYLTLVWSATPSAIVFTARVHYTRFEVVTNPTDPTLLRWGR